MSKKCVYKDKAGNKLYITGKHIYAKNKQGKTVNRRGVMTMLGRANRAKKIKFRK